MCFFSLIFKNVILAGNLGFHMFFILNHSGMLLTSSKGPEPPKKITKNKKHKISLCYHTVI